MMSQRDLLCEIGVEELPHELAHSTAINFKERFISLLKENRLEFKGIKYYSTPRRFAVLVESLEEKQKDYKAEKRGPSVDKAYKNGKPTKALIGFCSANKIKPEDVVIKNVKGSDYVFAIKLIEGKKSIELLPLILEEVLNNLHFPKNMKWEESGFRFIRPIRWILFLYGSQVIPFQKVGIESSNFSYGHRVYTKGEIIIDKPDSYEKALLDSMVLCNRENRKRRIKEEIIKLIDDINLFVPEEANILYDVNTDLTEYPVPVLCEFEKEYLTLPQEVLTSEMIEHQRYFPLYSKSTNRISNNFIAVSNIKDNSLTRYGYERVLRARLNDGKFFYDEDRKKEFAEYIKVLKNVSFHPKLGSMEEKVQRIKKIADHLCDLLNINENLRKDIETASLLCKNDLATLMVNEFPNLQGIMGYYYAISSGYSETIAKAIKEHYLPRNANDRLPEEVPGAIVGIADRLDSIVGIFSAGYEPRGSKDPYGLRRNVFSIVKIILDKRFDFNLSELIEGIVDLYPLVKDKNSFLKNVYMFFVNRIKSVFEDFGFAYDEIDATISDIPKDIYDSYRKVAALHDMRKDKSFQDLLVAFKRIANIISDKTGCPEEVNIKKELIKEKAEKDLYEYYLEEKESIREGIAEKRYKDVYKILGSFKPYVDKFFDDVLVMEDDMQLRCNRISMLKQILSSFSNIIDFSKIVVS